MRTTVGTLWYMAPEVFGNSYNEKCDIWSAGKLIKFINVNQVSCCTLCCVVFLLSMGKREKKLKQRFYKENQNLMVRFLIRKNGDFIDEDWREISSEAKDLITHMLTK